MYFFQAVNAERKALKLNPFLWKSFESLCQRGDNPDPATIFCLSNSDNFVQSQGLNPILQYANSLATQQQQQQPATALPTTTTATAVHHFAPHVNSGSVTSTPITNSSSSHQQQQPIKSFPHPGQVNSIEMTPQQQQQQLQQNGLPVPQLMMSMITPVHNQIESTLGGLDSCFTG